MLERKFLKGLLVLLAIMSVVAAILFTWMLY